MRWSKTAVTGFVLSLIGCLGITAALGLVFGIFGILATRGGRLRGRGLAVASIPISILSGAVSLLILLAITMGQELIAINNGLATLLKSEAARTEAALTQFRANCSDNFREAVSDDDLRAWLDQVQAKHGTLVSFGPPTPSEQRLAFHMEGKFTGGVADIEIRGVMTRWHLRLDDVLIDGSSPRRLE